MHLTIQRLHGAGLSMHFLLSSTKFCSWKQADPQEQQSGILQWKGRNYFLHMENPFHWRSCMVGLMPTKGGNIQLAPIYISSLTNLH